MTKDLDVSFQLSVWKIRTKN